MNWLNVPSAEPSEDYLPEYTDEFSGDNQDFPYFSVPETESSEKIERPAA